jgi:AcrR family transcriptional regulator
MDNSRGRGSIVEAVSDDGPGHGEGRAALMAAAVRVMDRVGMRGLTYRAVAQEAGVSHGLVRHHFGSRDALIREAVLDLSERALHSTHLGEGTGRLEDLGSGTTRMYTDPDNLPGVDYELILEARRRPELTPAVQALYDRYLAATQHELERLGLGDDPALTRLVFAALDGLVLQLLIYGRPDEADAAIARLHQLLGG